MGNKPEGGKLIPALLNILGILILLSVIATFLPVTVPRLMGYGIYNIVSGSMEPEIPVGSAVYVRPAEPADIEEGDVIAFLKGDSVVVHRAVENLLVEGEIRTKGDANEGEDLNTVDYGSVVGTVERHVPALGRLLVVYTSMVGKVYALCFAACGAMMNILAARLREQG